MFCLETEREVADLSWYEDEKFWHELYPFLFPESRFSKASEEVENIIKLSGKNTGKVLDLACGPGRHAVEFFRRGFTVTGLDKSPYLLSRAEEKAQKDGAKIEWVEEDMRKFCREESFDLVVNLFTSFGYFELFEDDLKVVQNVHKSLKKGGKLVLDLNGKENIARHFQASSCIEHENGSLLIERHRITEDWERIENEWIMVKKGKSQKFSFKLRLYSARELKELLEKAGFEKNKVFGSFAGDPYDEEALRLIAVAEK